MFLFLAADSPIKGIPDDIPELERALADLPDEHLRPAGTSDPYWARIRATLLAHSSAHDLDTARKEWAYKGKPFPVENSTCELCGKHPIIWNFPILNKSTKKTLNIGSECIVNFLAISHFKVDIEKVRAIMLREIHKLDREKDQRKKSPDRSKDIEDLITLESSIGTFIEQAATGNDFEIFAHMESLNEASKVLAALGIVGPAYEAGRKAILGCIEVAQIAKKVGLNATPDVGVLRIVKAIHEKRGNKDRKEQLQSLRGGLVKVFQGRSPNEVLIRMYEAIDGFRQKLIAEAEARVDMLKAKVRSGLAKDLEYVDHYQHLHFLINRGVAVFCDVYDERLRTYDGVLGDKGLIDKIAKKGEAAAKALELKNAIPEMNIWSFRAPAVEGAVNVMLFLRAIRQKQWKHVLDTLAETFGREIKDEAGVEASILQAADDSVVFPEEHGVKAIDEFAGLIHMRSPEAIRCVLKDVDDLKDAKFGEAKLFDRMTKDLGFDVEDTFRYFDADNADDRKACRTLVGTWQAGKKPTASEIKVFIVRKSMRPEKPKHSMLDQLRHELGSDVGWIIKQARLVAMKLRNAWRASA